MFDLTDRRLTRGYILVIVVIVICCFAAGSHFSESKRPAFSPPEVDFSDGWAYRDGHIASLPGAFGDREKEIVLEKKLPEVLPEDALLVVSSSYLPVRAYIGIEEMPVSGTFITSAFNVIYANSRSVISVSKLYAGKTVRLEILCDGYGSKFIPEVYSVWLGSEAKIQAFSLLSLEYTNIVVLVMLILGLVMIMLGTVLWLRGSRDNCYEIFLSAAFLMLCAIWFFTDMGGNTIRYGHNGAYLFINLFSFLLISAPLVLLVRNNITVARGFLAYISAAPVALSLIVTLLLSAGIFKLSITLTVSHFIVVVMMASILIAVAWDLFCNGNRRAKLFFACSLVLVSTGLATMLSFYLFCLADNTLYFRYGLVLITLVLAVRTISLTVTRTIDARNLETLRYAASHDALTGIYNREAFYNATKRFLDKTSYANCLIGSLDIERFSLINDVFGREQGNDILRFIADTLKTTFCESGTYARLESDKFLFCFPREKYGVEELCARLQRAVSDYALGYNITLSFGFFIVSADKLSVAAMVDRACIARETIKDNYIKRWAIYDDSLRRTMLYKQNIINSLHSSIENGDIWIALQPKFSLSNMRVNGAEALARWRHPTLGDLSPSSFIPVLEQNGLIIDLDNRVWELAAQTLREWIDEFGVENTPPISINVSRIHLFKTNLVNILTSLIKRYDIPAGLLAIEITESVYSSDPATLSRITDELHALGFKIHMDDFGSGYSSLNMLKNIKVDVIKLDMLFLIGEGDEKRSLEIIKAVVKLAMALGIYVIAEGVENENQALMLRDIGCDEAQGYCFGRPGKAEDITNLIRESKTGIAKSGADDGASSITNINV